MKLRLKLLMINVTFLRLKSTDFPCPWTIDQSFVLMLNSLFRAQVKNSFLTRLCGLLLAFAGVFGSTLAHAYDWGDGFNLSSREGDRINLMVSPYTLHFHPSDEHKYVWLLGMERERANGAIAGAAFFSNSFGQDSAYIFPWGEIYRGVLDQPRLYAKWTAGLLYGYRGKYEDKVPFNHGGFSPAIVPALGWEFEGKQQMQVNLLGFNGLMLQFIQPLK